MPQGEIQRLLHRTGRLQVQNPHPHPHHHHHYDDFQVSEAIQDVKLCWRRQKCRLLHCNQDKAQVSINYCHHHQYLNDHLKYHDFSVTELCALCAVTVGSSRRTWWPSASAAGRKRSGVSRQPSPIRAPILLTWKAPVLPCGARRAPIQSQTTK